MRDGEVNHLSVEPSWLNSTRVIVPHTTSWEYKAYGGSDGEQADARGNYGIFYAEWVIAGGRIATFAPGHWRTERCRSQDIVVSARGWLVVNPLGVATPTVGWRWAPLSAVAFIAELISDKCFTYLASWIYMLSRVFIDLWICTYIPV